MSVLCFCYFHKTCLISWLIFEVILYKTVPCLRRAASIEEEYEAAGGEVLLDDEDNDGWLATHGKPKGAYSIGSKAWILCCAL